MNVSLDENVDAADAIELKLLILVVSPVTHASHVCPARVVLLVSYSQS